MKRTSRLPPASKGNRASCLLNEGAADPFYFLNVWAPVVTKASSILTQAPAVKLVSFI